MGKLLTKVQWLALPVLALVVACAAMMMFEVSSAYAQDAQIIDVNCTVLKNSNVRSGPGTNFKVVSGLKVGAEVTVDDANDDKSWLHHATGWTAAKLLDCTGENVKLSAMVKVKAEKAISNTMNITSTWAITWYPGATPQMRGKGEIPWVKFPQLDPHAWPNFPDVANEMKAFPAEWGLMYEEDETQFCGTADDSCAVVVPAGHYMLITGDWRLKNLGECHGSEEVGCAVSIVNVGTVSAEFEGVLNNVFIVWGRYHHGDHLPEAISGLMSHATYNMTDGVSKLNPEKSVNAGANCSVVSGCFGVNNQAFVTSGGELLIHAEANWFLRK